MAEADEAPLMSKQTKQAVLVLANLFMYSVAMFTLPFIAFFGVRHALSEYYHLDTFTVNVWSVVAAVVVVNIIIFVYVYKAYHEKEYDEHGNEIDQHKYDPVPAESSAAEKSTLNLKQD